MPESPGKNSRHYEVSRLEIWVRADFLKISLLIIEEKYSRKKCIFQVSLDFL